MWPECALFGFKTALLIFFVIIILIIVFAAIRWRWIAWLF